MNKGFLDYTGLSKYTQKILSKFVPATRTINGNALSSDVVLTAEDIGDIPHYTPVISEDCLLGWTNNAGLENPDPVNIKGPKGDRGPDGNPIGTVISYMGYSAPDNYVICDGAIYNIVDYEELSNFFQMQFGSKNYFGGNGTSTFAVPDMRNLFLRGYHGSATVLSGDIGAKQDGTVHPYIYVNSSTYVQMSEKMSPIVNFDSKIGSAQSFDVLNYNARGVKDFTGYTSRPVNMAVLYCIKAVESTSASSEGISSITDEQIDALFFNEDET